MLTWTNICEHFSQSESQRKWTTIAGAGGTGTRRERAGLEHAGRGTGTGTRRSGRDWNTQVAGAGGTGTRRSRERAGLRKQSRAGL